MQRLFTSGSRQAPDPYDQFLEQHNFYRKHTARDSSCLFRVISEQMYDTQIHHLDIRKKCVQYMRKHRRFFQNLVGRDIDDYLDDLAKPKTFGSLVELQAIGFMFQRNVILFEPFSLGNYFSTRSYFYKVFRVFYSPERHFDSVFKCSYIRDAAICQAICYEILYKDLFMLPDVNYAVEKMLHGGAYESCDSRFEHDENGYASRVYLTSGRCFELDTPEKTFCILENYKFCHFHYDNFPRFTEQLHRDRTPPQISQVTESIESTTFSRTVESLLPDKYVSCVRQLLREGITPFPYKVAKALDPSMYRNIEFDAWNEARKEQRMANWYLGDTNFKVGAKCHVKLRKSENDLYTCHIQEISMDKGYCVVFIEQLGEKRMVPYDSLQPLPADQFKPWSLPYRLQRHPRFPRHYNYQIKYSNSFPPPPSMDYCSQFSSVKSENWEDFNEKGRHHIMQPWYNNKDNYYYRIKQFTNLENFQPPAIEYCTMPLTLDINSAKQVEGQEKGNETPNNQGSSNNLTTPNPNVSEAFVKSEVAEGHNLHNEPNGDESNAVQLQMHPEEGMLINGFENMSMDPNMAPMNVTGTYMADGCCYYGTYANPYYAPVEDYYNGGYSYDYPVSCHTGPVYYMYSQPPSYTYAPNVYIPAAAPSTHALGGIQTQSSLSYPAIAPAQSSLMATPTAASLPTVMHTSQSAHTPTFSATSHISPLIGGPPPTLSTPNIPSLQYSSASYNSPNTRGRHGSYNVSSNSTTPTNVRVNTEARKSLKPNGIDLPQDINTLRYFYNLGVDYYWKNKQKPGEGAGGEKFQNDQLKDKEKLDENGNQREVMKSDANNNPMNYNVPANKTNQYNSRRFSSSRFFGPGRDRPNTNRNNNGGSSTANSNQQNYTNRNQQHHQNDHHPNNNNKNNFQNKSSAGGGGGGNNANTPNSSRSQIGNSSSGIGGNGSGGVANSMSNSSVPSTGRVTSTMNTPHNNDHGATRPSSLINSEHHSNTTSCSGQMNYMAPSSGLYDQNGTSGDHNSATNMYAAPPPTTPSGSSIPPSPFANGMFVPMGPPPPPFGMYPPNGPPPQMNQAQAGSMNGPPNGGFLQPPPTPTMQHTHFSNAAGAQQYAQVPPPNGPGLMPVNNSGHTMLNGVNHNIYVTPPNGSNDPNEANNGNAMMHPENGSIMVNHQHYYPTVSYPPPGPPPQPLAAGMPYYYPTMGGASNMPANGTVIVNNTTPNPGQPVYWSQQAPPPPITGANLASQATAQINPQITENFANCQKSPNANMQSSASSAGSNSTSNQASNSGNKRHNNFNKQNAK